MAHPNHYALAMARRNAFRAENGLNNYLKFLDSNTPLYRDQYNFTQASDYTRLAVSTELHNILDPEKDRLPNFNPLNLATVDVHQLFTSHPDFYKKICKMIARSVVQAGSIARNCSNQQFVEKFVDEALILSVELHEAIPQAQPLPTSSAMTPSQNCLACIIADILLASTGSSCLFQNTFKSVLLTSGVRAWNILEPEYLAAIVEHFKVFLTGKVVLDNQDGAWAKVTYLEPKNNVRSDPVPITTTTRSIIIVRGVAAAPADNQLVFELEDVYEAHPPQGKMTTGARNNVSTIRLDFIDDKIIWLSTRSGSAKHNSYFRQNIPKRKEQNDAAGFRFRGPMYNWMITVGRLISYNAIRRFDSPKKFEDYKKILLDFSNLKIGLSDGKVDNHKFEEGFPCLVKVEVLSDYVQYLLSQKPLSIKETLLREFYNLPKHTYKSVFSYDELDEIYWLLLHLMFNALK